MSKLLYLHHVMDAAKVPLSLCISSVVLLLPTHSLLCSVHVSACHLALENAHLDMLVCPTPSCEGLARCGTWGSEAESTSLSDVCTKIWYHATRHLATKSLSLIEQSLLEVGKTRKSFCVAAKVLACGCLARCLASLE